MSFEHSLAVRAFLDETKSDATDTIKNFRNLYYNNLDRDRADFYRLTAILKIPSIAQYQADFLAKKNAPLDQRGLLRWLLLFIFYKAGEGDIRIDLEDLKNTGGKWISQVIQMEDEGNTRFTEDIKKLKELFSQIDTKKYNIIEDFPRLFGPNVPDSPLFYSGGRFIYTDRNRSHEQGIETFLRNRLLREVPKEAPEPPAVSAFIKSLEDENGFSYEEKQKEAIKTSLNKDFVIVSGGPGTGKTTVIVGIIKALINFNTAGRDLKIDLAAPTGRAANRMLESIKNQGDFARMPEEAWTLHKLIGIHSWQMMKPRRNRDYPLQSDVVIIDESSMVDFKMAFFLLDALSEETKVIFVGDGNQLPSVEGGSFFSDLIEMANKKSGTLLRRHIVMLERSKRSNKDITKLAGDIQTAYGNKTKIAEVAKGLKKGEYPCIEFHNLPEKRYFVEKIIKEWNAYYLLKNSHFAGKDDFYGKKGLLDELFAAFSRFSVLAPAKLTPYGVETLNAEINATLRKGAAVYPGQPIMITGNNWELGLFNGDRGIVVSIGEKMYGVFPESGSKEFPYRAVPINRLGHFDTAYATTIHKSQGSEFDTVYIVMDDESERVVSQQLIYTAITRAKNKVVILSTEEMLVKSLSQKVERESGLKDFLSDSGGEEAEEGEPQLSLF